MLILSRRPQQHYLYTNQYEWVRWSAVDSATGVTRSLPPTITGTSSIQRPDTPPSETEIQAAVGVATTKPAEQAQVPGQPRKTPGAKSRHGVAMPENNDEDADPADELMLVKDPVSDIVAEAEMDEMQLDSATAVAMHLVDPPPKSKVDKERTPAAEADEVPVVRAASSGRAHTRSASAAARPKNKAPLSSSDKSAAGQQRSPGGSVPRSKAVKDLGSMFNQPEAVTPSNGAKGYNLRSASGGNIAAQSARSSPSDSKSTSATVPVVEIPVSNPSPTRLPQRVNKRRGKAAAQAQQPDTFLLPSTAAPALPGKITRSGRRRRSSMTATDI